MPATLLVCARLANAEPLRNYPTLESLSVPTTGLEHRVEALSIAWGSTTYAEGPSLAGVPVRLSADRHRYPRHDLATVSLDWMISKVEASEGDDTGLVCLTRGSCSRSRSRAQCHRR